MRGRGEQRHCGERLGAQSACQGSRQKARRAPHRRTNAAWPRVRQCDAFMQRICVAARGRTVNAARELAESGAVTLSLVRGTKTRGAGVRCAPYAGALCAADAAAAWYGRGRRSGVPRCAPPVPPLFQARGGTLFAVRPHVRSCKASGASARCSAHVWHAAAPKSAAWQRRRGHTSHRCAFQRRSVPWQPRAAQLVRSGAQRWRSCSGLSAHAASGSCALSP